MGNEPGETNAIGPRAEKVLNRSSGLFLQMGGGEALSNTERTIIRFLWQNILCRYGVPRRLISDNGRQLQGRRIWEWCQNLRIEQSFNSVAHPQPSGQVEVINRIILQGIKTKLEVA